MNFEDEFLDRTIRFIKQSLNPPTIKSTLTRLKKTKVAISLCSKVLKTIKGQHMVTLTANLLSRFCWNIDFFLQSYIKNKLSIPILNKGSLASSIRNLCNSINPIGNFEVNPKQTNNYRVVIVIGKEMEDVDIPSKYIVYINSDGWVAYVSTEKGIVIPRGDDSNPLGALLAACFGVGEAFKAIFHGIKGIENRKIELVTSLMYSLLNNTYNEVADNTQLPSQINLGTIYLVGAGAIGCSVAYTLSTLPNLKGRIIVIDPQEIEASNLNRMPLATSYDIGKKKVEIIERITSNDLEIIAHPKTFQEYIEEMDPKNLDIVVDTVDDVKTHWFIQKLFPRVILNGGTMVENVQIVRVDDFLNKSCLGCFYPRSQASLVADIPYASISFISMMAGILITSEILKERINIGRKIDNMLYFNGLHLDKTYILTTRYDKLDSCGVKCKSEVVRKLYMKNYYITT